MAATRSNASSSSSRPHRRTAPAETLPGFVRGIINGALANGTPIVVAYTDENGQPVLSLRGSTQVYSDTQLCIWVRNADGGIVRTMARNPRVSLLYRDSKTRTTLIIQGRGHVETSPEVRDRVFALSPEVEQNHDTARKGAALIIDITSLQGSSVRGMVRVTPGCQKPYASLLRSGRVGGSSAGPSEAYGFRRLQSGTLG